MPPPDESGVRFENQGEEFGRPPEVSEGFNLTGKLVEWGLVSSQAEAQYALIGVAAVALLASAFFLFGFGGGSDIPPPPPVF